MAMSDISFIKPVGSTPEMQFLEEITEPVLNFTEAHFSDLNTQINKCILDLLEEFLHLFAKRYEDFGMEKES